MRCSEIINILEELAPHRMACEWDNPGLLAGRKEKEVKKLLLCVDADDEAVALAVRQGADMIVSHHPLIFRSIKRVTDEDFIGRRLVEMIQSDLSYFAMHTNFDAAPGCMADLAADYLKLENCQILDVTGENESGEPEGIGRVGEIPSASDNDEQRNEISLADYCEEVKKAFALDTVKVFGDLKQNVHRVAICPGSGKSDIDQAIAAGADVYVTGDIGHHEGIDAVAQGLAIIDGGHYGIEHIFIEDMRQYLEKNLKDVEVISAPIIHPFLLV